jgi:hypothetical protein
MNRLTRESYSRVVERATTPATLIAATCGEIRKLENFRARELRKGLAGIKLALMNYLASEDASAKVRDQIMGAPLKGE